MKSKLAPSMPNFSNSSKRIEKSRKRRRAYLCSCSAHNASSSVFRFFFERRTDIVQEIILKHFVQVTKRRNLPAVRKCMR